jgi:predicted unusual protein kinase regulating ubiquinone biosynthesis (AarF/ABC1/UbiB family)
VTVVAASTRLAQGKTYFAELRESMMEELDYRHEAERARQYAAAAAPLPDLVVPRSFPHLTAEKVLTLELLTGPTVKEFLSTLEQHDNAERFRASRLLTRAIWGPFLLSGAIHSDPHPGNFLLLPDGRVGVLDFGAIKQMSPAWVDVNRRLFLAVVRDEPIDVIRLSEESGFVFEPWEGNRAFVQTVLDIGTQPVRSRDFDYGTCGISRDMRSHFLKHATKLGAIRPPKESLQFYRAIGGLTQNLENLKARGDFRAVYEELLALAPR